MEEGGKKDNGFSGESLNINQSEGSKQRRRVNVNVLFFKVFFTDVNQPVQVFIRHDRTSIIRPAAELRARCMPGLLADARERTCRCLSPALRRVTLRRATELPQRDARSPPRLNVKDQAGTGTSVSERRRGSHLAGVHPCLTAQRAIAGNPSIRAAVWLRHPLRDQSPAPLLQAAYPHRQACRPERTGTTFRPRPRYRWQ